MDEIDEDENSKALIEAKWIRKEFINKCLIIGTIVIITIIVSSIAGIIVVNSYNKKMLEEEIQTNDEEIVENEEVIEENETVYPVYSEEARNKVSNIYKSSDGEETKKAYLTFDDGPSENITPQILQILEEENIKATFFVLGSRVERYPELVKQEYEAGHYIGNHRIFT